MNNKKMKVILSVAVILLVTNTLLLILAFSSISKLNKQHNQLQYSVSDIQIDYNQIEEMIANTVIEKADIDYNKIEEIMEEKMKDINKSFGEKLEDASSYFGEQIKDTYTDIKKYIKERQEQ